MLAVVSQKVVRGIHGCRIHPSNSRHFVLNGRANHPPLPARSVHALPAQPFEAQVDHDWPLIEGALDTCAITHVEDALVVHQLARGPAYDLPNAVRNSVVGHDDFLHRWVRYVSLVGRQDYRPRR
jgi:hypothetical protein